MKESQYNIIIENGIIIDGTGGEPFKADVGIVDGEIKAIGNLKNITSEERIDASNRYVCPGFIDAHNHTDTYAAYFPSAEAKLMQGVTTDVCGLCGISPAPIGNGWLGEYNKRNRNTIPGTVLDSINETSFKEYLEKINTQGNSTNMAMFVGNSNLRINAMGYEEKKATDKELKTMKLMLRQAMEEGAFGLSTGLTYVPSMFSSTEELIELCKVISPYGGIYNSHMRNEGNEVLESVKEVIKIAKMSGCHGHISHLKVMGKKNHGKSTDCLALIDKANKEGINVTFDIYPYTAGSTELSTLLPGWVLSQGFGDDFSILTDRQEEILKDLQKEDWDNIVLSCGYNNIFIGAADNKTQYEGKSIAQIAKENGMSEYDAVVKVLKDSKGHATMIYYSVSENDISNLIKSPRCMIGTDAYARHYEGPTASGKPHPRNYGGFPRYIRRYLIDNPIISLQEGIFRITGFPAKVFGLGKRGILKNGYIADVTIFNPDTIVDKGDYLEPNKKPEGIDWVIVNGQVVVKEGEFIDLREGRMLTHEI